MTGIRKLGDREMLVNPRDQAAMDELVRVGEQAGFTIKTSTV
jgi:hypothetical protein